MKFRCFQKDLSDAISKVQRAIPTRSTMPVLQGILVEAKENTVKLTGTDLDITIQTLVAAEVMEEGSVVMPSRIFGDVIKRFPEAAITLQLNDKSQMDILYKDSVCATLQGLDPQDYPEVQQVEKIVQIELTQNVFKNMIKQTTFAASTNDTKPILTGALVEVSKGYITMVCLDGYRLALRKEFLPGYNRNISVIVPCKALNEISRVLADKDVNLDIYIDYEHIHFDLGNTQIISQLLEGEFIDYTKLISKDYKTKVKVNRLLFQQCLERAALMVRGLENNLVKLSIQDGKLIVTSNSDIGRIHERLSVTVEGANLDIAFNVQYLLDVMRAIDDDEIVLEFTTSVSPGIIRPLEGDAYCYLILPVRLVN